MQRVGFNSCDSRHRRAGMVAIGLGFALAVALGSPKVAFADPVAPISADGSLVDDPSVNEHPARIAAEVAPGERADVSVAVVDTKGEMTIRKMPVQGPQEAATAVSKAQRDPATVAVGIAAPVTMLAAASDPRRPQQWALDTLGAEQSWQVSTGKGQVVAVVDTGVQSNHPDLAGQVLPGVDLTRGTAIRASQDPIGHGTHVAGTVAALTRNGVESPGWPRTPASCR